LKDPSLDERIILRWIFRKWNGDISWIDLALRFHKMWGIS